MRSTVEKTSQNVNLNEQKPRVNLGGGIKNKHAKSFSFGIQVGKTDIPRLHAAMNQELTYYNKLIDGLSPLLKNSHEFLLSITGDYYELFKELAYTGFNVRPLANKNNVELPENLKKFERILLGKDENNKRYLNDKLLEFYKLALPPSGILPLTRKNMAGSLLKHYQDQAKVIQGGSPASAIREFNTYIDMLEKPDELRKRHVQIFKDDIKWAWDHENEETVLKLPYISKKARVPVNLNEFVNWNLVIIHQEPGQIPSSDTPWIIEFKNNDGYMYKYMDVNNPYVGAYHGGKPKKFW